MRRAGTSVGLWVAAVALLLGCPGKGSIFLTIEPMPGSTVKIPDDVSSVSVSVTADKGGAELLNKSFELGDQHRFPLTLGLEPGGHTGQTVQISVTAYKGDAAVSAGHTSVAIEPAEASTVTLRLLPVE